MEYGAELTGIREINMKIRPLEVLPEPMVFGDMVRLEFTSKDSARWVITPPRVSQPAEQDVQPVDLSGLDCEMKHMKISDRTYFSPVMPTVVDFLIHSLEWRRKVLGFETQSTE